MVGLELGIHIRIFILTLVEKSFVEKSENFFLSSCQVISFETPLNFVQTYYLKGIPDITNMFHYSVYGFFQKKN